MVEILKKHVSDTDIIHLLENVIYSFFKAPGRGLPLGNLTSQLFVNIYMNEFDQFMKRELKVDYYIRFADDFVIFHESKAYLENLISKISEFLYIKLKLLLHPDKVFIKTVASGVDFLGWVNFTHHRILRTTTRRRMRKRLKSNPPKESKSSYLGLLSHGNTYKLREEISKEISNL